VPGLIGSGVVAVDEQVRPPGTAQTTDPGVADPPTLVPSQVPRARVRQNVLGAGCWHGHVARADRYAGSGSPDGPTALLW
jgi:hypothetical protein